MRQKSMTKNIHEGATPAMKKAAVSIEKYAKQHGGIDKADFMKAARMLASGKAGANFVKFVDDLDTDPREWLITNLAKTMGKQTVEKMFKVKIREEVELDEAARQPAVPKRRNGRKGAPKMTGDSVAIQRAKDAAHNKAMGRTKTGRKKPVRTMTSTQRSLASLRGENYVSAAQRKAVWATKKDGGKGHPDYKKEEVEGSECECCGNKINAQGKCGCGPDCKHCGGQHNVKENRTIKFKSFVEARGEDSKGHKRATDKGAGLTQKGVDAYNRKTGGNLQTAVTGKVKPGSKAAGRRKSFCARMGGMKGPMKDDKGRPTRKAMSLKRWKC
jgi:hypothetical protein